MEKIPATQAYIKNDVGIAVIEFSIVLLGPICHFKILKV